MFVLDGKNLTLDGIDLVVDVSDLSPEQTALFSCSAANLTLRNCSITILNQSTLGLVRGRSRGARRSRVPPAFDWKGRLVRGLFSLGFRAGGRSRSSRMKQSVLLGGPGPLIRVTDGGFCPGTAIVLSRQHPGWAWAHHPA